MASLIFLASASLRSRSARAVGVSSGGGRRTTSRGSSLGENVVLEGMAAGQKAEEGSGLASWTVTAHLTAESNEDEQEQCQPPGRGSVEAGVAANREPAHLATLGHLRSIQLSAAGAPSLWFAPTAAVQS